MARRVAIIGAGISGLLACKYTSEHGFNPIVFEEQTSVGGVWTHTVRTTKLQSPRDVYQFSDFPWPSSVKEEFPDHNQVIEYIESYARHFDILRCIKFNSKVIGIEYEGASDEEILSWNLWGGTGDPFSPRGKWNIVIKDILNQSTEVYQVEFVILCIGRFCGVPNIPDFPPNKGPEAFDGKVIHSMDYSAMDDTTAVKFVQGKRVTIVGSQKSAFDSAVECTMANGVENPCTMVYKTDHWNILNFCIWGVPLCFLYHTRFAELMLHKPGEGLILSLLATLLFPLSWARSKFVEGYIKWELPLKKYKIIPNHSFLQEISSCVTAIIPNNFFNRVEEGSIILKKSKNFSFCKDGLIIDAEFSPLETDVVIFATGYKSDEKLKNIFTSPTFQKHIMGSPTSTVPLYRECIHPRIPQLAVIGYSESLSNLFTSEMRCRWLVHLLEGTFKLPSIKEMEDDVLRWEKYMKQYTGEYYRRSSVSIIHIWYNDQLCKDMGCNPKRKKGYLAELFEPYGPMDYTNISSR